MMSSTFPGTVLVALHTSSHLILTTAEWGRFHYSHIYQTRKWSSRLSNLLMTQNVTKSFLTAWLTLNVLCEYQREVIKHWLDLLAHLVLKEMMGNLCSPKLKMGAELSCHSMLNRWSPGQLSASWNLKAPERDSNGESHFHSHTGDNFWGFSPVSLQPRKYRKWHGLKDPLFDIFPDQVTGRPQDLNLSNKDSQHLLSLSQVTVPSTLLV